MKETPKRQSVAGPIKAQGKPVVQPASPSIPKISWSTILHNRLHMILRLKTLPHARRIVLFWLAFRFNKSARGYPSTVTGARFCGMEVAEFEEHLIALALEGHLRINANKWSRKKEGFEAVQIQLTLTKRWHKPTGQKGPSEGGTLL